MPSLVDAPDEQQSFAAAGKLFSQSRGNAGNRRRRIHLKACQLRFSFANVALQALSHNSGWPEQWRSPEPKAAYDVVIVGAGGHGLATAYYLAKEHGITNVAVLEKGWLGGGNTGRNTTIIRSNYLWDESAALYEHALKLWEGLSQELNYNVMYSPRGVMMLAHNVHDVQVFKRHVHANRLNGIDNEWLTPEEAKAFCPPLNIARTSAIRSSAPRCSGAAAPRATTRSPGAMRARRRCARRRHHPELRGDRRSAATRPAPSRASRRRAASSRQEGRRRRRRPYHGGHGDGRRAHAARELSAAGAGLGAGQAGLPVRRDVEHHPRLHLAVRQGRAGHRRRHRRLRLLSPDRRPAHRRAYARRDLRALPDVPRA